MSSHPIHLCIGAPRAGTTWLFREMSEHPALFVPQAKEVRYWNSRRANPQRDATIAATRAQLDKMHDAADQTAWLDKWEDISRVDEPDMGVYTNLMSVEGRPSLDITPSYCFLPPKLIQILRDGLPKGSKVIYLMRDPMDRIQSQVKLHYSLHGMYRGRPSSDDLAAFIEVPHQQKRWDYAGVMKRWGRVFGDDFMPLAFEEVVKDPRGLTLKVAETFGFELTQDALARSDEEFAHSEKNQNSQIWVSNLGPIEKKQLATAMLPAITTFAEKMPKPGNAWLSKLTRMHNAETPRPEVIKDVDLQTQKLMRMTESLGDNCEYGFWQRHRGYEPSSLFRWAITPIESLLAFLEKPAPLFAKTDLAVHSPGMVNDAKFGFKFHSKLVERDAKDKLHLLADQEAFDATYEAEAAKISHLQAKFVAQVRRQTALYIIKDNKGLSEEQARAVLAHLRAKNANHHLLWVEADAPEGTPASLTDLGDGLLRGGLPAFAPYTVADGYAEGGWSALMTLASQHETIAQQIKTMQR